MQRIAVLLASVAALPLMSAPAAAQEAAGTALWRLAGTTLPVPPALATGTAATFWNPAQREDSVRTQLALEGIQTPTEIGASGVLAAVRMRARSLGYVGLLYGRVGLSDLTRTSDTPDPIGPAVPVFTYALGVTWSRAFGRTTLGATLAYHETRLDAAHAGRVTLDVGTSYALDPAGRLRIAATTHFISALSVNDPAQDLYAGIEARLWQGPLWGDRAVVRGRYGVAFGHGFGADHQAGLGLDLGGVVGLDASVVREGSYGSAGWRPVAGIRVTIGKYRITLARGVGVNDLGSAYRVGVNARFQ
jgi:hypothetical protein